jgi:phosphoenolpyruvate carboxylase
MQALSISIRRKDATKENSAGFYGNATEEVTSGENKGKQVPCIVAENKLVPSVDEGKEVWLNELIQNIGGEDNLKFFTERVFGTELQKKARGVFVNLKEDAEATEEKRNELVNKAVKAVESFTFADLVSEGLTAKNALDELKSAEMEKLMTEDPQEFIRRTMAIINKTK